jgi:hypothetical protein
MEASRRRSTPLLLSSIEPDCFRPTAREAQNGFVAGSDCFVRPAKAEMSQIPNMVGCTGVDGWDSYIFLHARAGLAGLDPVIPDEVK